MPSNADVRDVETVGNSLIAVSNRMNKVWFGFMAVGAYLVLTIASITDKDLILETPLKLPIFDITLPVVFFCVVSSFLFIFFHFYTFINILDFSQHAFHYENVLTEAVPQADRRTFAVQNLDVSLLIRYFLPQYFIWYTHIFARIIYVVTLFVLPVLFLTQVHLKVLPYQNEGLSWFNRLIFAVDLAGCIFMFYLIQIGAPKYHNKKGWMNEFNIIWMFSVVSLFASIFILNYPGEFIYFQGNPLTRYLLENDKHDRSIFGLIVFSNRLHAAHLQLIDSNQYEKGGITISLRDRSFRGAMLNGSDLRGVDFTDADLTDANFVQAKLSKAIFDCSNPLSKYCSHLENADLARSNLDGAMLHNAKMDGASLISASLVGAELDGASVNGADFRNADLSNATLQSISALGASFDRATLSMTKTIKGDLDGTSILDPQGNDIPNIHDNYAWTSSKEEESVDNSDRLAFSNYLMKKLCDSHNLYMLHGMIHNDILSRTGNFYKLFVSLATEGSNKCMLCRI